MIGVSVEMRVKPGRGAELEQIMATLAEAIEREEPGTRVFSLSRSRDDENLYTAFEIYESAAAIELHGATEHLRIARLGFAEVLESKRLDWLETTTLVSRNVVG